MTPVMDSGSLCVKDEHFLKPKSKVNILQEEIPLFSLMRWQGTWTQNVIINAQNPNSCATGNPYSSWNCMCQSETIYVITDSYSTNQT